MPKIKCREFFGFLQNFTKGEIPLVEIAQILIDTGVAKQNQENSEYARQHAWKVPDGFFESIRNQIQKSPISEQIRG